MATYFGEQTSGAIANTRAMGAVLGGLLGGQLLVFLLDSQVGCIVILWEGLQMLPVPYRQRWRDCLPV